MHSALALAELINFVREARLSKVVAECAKSSALLYDGRIQACSS
ncbi:hypothetical protein MPL3356_110321 [Mesorhizobium plurifarium]|uniref:Uncharacterized protein n=1 Tax=Mesorhizobium plurifarium TaxID=69974 RepID=A0A090DAC3_MESPL|nr:hypothetical protein MPL3356_110321 [Mesorhizobium plurifarium]CDX51880.1 hypothetical protein MPL3365_140090 [Mesorhizobium plurifarium]